MKKDQTKDILMEFAEFMFAWTILCDTIICLVNNTPSMIF